jgi:exonuclease III
MVCHLDEKRGGTRRLETESEHFQALIDTLGLIDLETQNGLFTWSNRRSGSQQVACRLDLFLVSETLLMEGLVMSASILDISGSTTGLFSSHWTSLALLDGSPSDLNASGLTT